MPMQFINDKKRDPAIVEAEKKAKISEVMGTPSVSNYPMLPVDPVPCCQQYNVNHNALSRKPLGYHHVLGQRDASRANLHS